MSTYEEPRDGTTGEGGYAKREVWFGSDGFAHDGQRLFAYSRGGKA